MELLYAAHVPPGDGPHPTLLLLHGWGASAHDLLGLAPVLHRGNALVLCPQGPLAFQAGPGAVGYGWFPLVPDRPPEARAVEAARAALERFLGAALDRYPVDRRRLVIGGFSQGGFMACQIALRDPARFAGLMALSSWLPSDLAQEIPRTAAHAELPTLLIHGSDDPLVSVERAREARDILLRLGVPTVYREYAMGHEIRPEVLGAILEWLEDKVLSPILI
ncbi:MAG TPA: alpha/beta fold hydrolase [Myxococcota bacterium]